MNPRHEVTEESYLARLNALFPVAEPIVEEEPEPPTAAPPPVDLTWFTRLRQFTSQHLKVVSSLALVAVILSTWMVMRARTVSLDEPVDTPTWSEPSPTPTPTPTPTHPPDWMIHVLGAVASPGVVSVPPGSRVIDAIDAAGGFSPDADPASLNLAAILVDGAQIMIGTTEQPLGEVRQGANGDTPLSEVGSESTENTIDLNQANETQLDTLPGVGPVTAQAILAWRQNNGSFTSVDQLLEVDGIGPKTYAQIQPHVRV